VRWQKGERGVREGNFVFAEYFLEDAWDSSFEGSEPKA